MPKSEFNNQINDPDIFVDKMLDYSHDLYLSEKVVSVDFASQVIEKLRRRNLSSILVSGVFDIIHIGHLSLLIGAKKRADFLFVATPTDEDICINKNSNRPINSLANRMKLLASISAVDVVFAQPSWMMLDVLSLVRPDKYGVWSTDDHMASRIMQTKSIGCKLELIESQDNEISTTKIFKQLGLE